MKEFIDYITNEITEEDFIENIDISEYEFYKVDQSKILSKKEFHDSFPRELLYYSHCFNSNNILMSKLNLENSNIMKSFKSNFQILKKNAIQDIKTMLSNEKIDNFIKSLNFKTIDNINLQQHYLKIIVFNLFNKYKNIADYEVFKAKIEAEANKELNEREIQMTNYLADINKHMLIHPYCLEIRNINGILEDANKILFFDLYISLIDDLINECSLWDKQDLKANIFTELKNKNILKDIYELKKEKKGKWKIKNIFIYVNKGLDNNDYLNEVKELKKEYMQNKWFISNQNNLIKESINGLTTNLYNIIIQDHPNLKINFLGKDSLILLKDNEVDKLIDFTKFFNNSQLKNLKDYFYIRTQSRNNLNNIEDLYTINELYNDSLKIIQFDYVKNHNNFCLEDFKSRQDIEYLLFLRFPILKKLLNSNTKDLKDFKKNFTEKINLTFKNKAISLPFLNTYISFKNEFINFFEKKLQINIHDVLYKFLTEYMRFEFLLILKALEDHKKDNSPSFIKRFGTLSDIKADKIYQKLGESNNECFRVKFDTMFTFLSIFDTIETIDLIETKNKIGGSKNFMKTFNNFDKQLWRKKSDIVSDIEFFYEIGAIFTLIVYKHHRGKQEVKEGYINDLIRQNNSERIVEVLRRIYKKYSFDISNGYIKERLNKIFKYKMSSETIPFNNDCENSLLIGVLDATINLNEQNNYKGGR